MGDWTRAVGEALSGFEGWIGVSEPLAPHTTIGIGGPARLFLIPESPRDLDLIAWLIRKGWPWLILGQGSKMLITDDGWPGVVIKLGRGFSRIEVEGRRVRAGAGASLSQLIETTARLGLAGLEPFVGIPGSVGGCLRMNAGAFGSWFGDWVLRVEGRWVTGGEKSYLRRRLRFSYRESSLPKEFLVTHVELELWPDEPERIRMRLRERLNSRRQSQPEGRSAGCIFKNPVGGPAGELLDRCGLKGVSVGDAFVSPRHANFIINRGRATFEQVLQLIEYMKERVKAATGIELEEEIIIVRGG